MVISRIGNKPISNAPQIIKNKGMGAYLNLLCQLHKKGALGKLAIYPAIGVDGLLAQHIKVVGLNLWFEPYTADEIIEHLSPILPAISSLKPKLKNNLTYFTHVDSSNSDFLIETLKPYQDTSPKSLIIKGLFENVFLSEWDRDTERYYPVAPQMAQRRAEGWIKTMTDWLKSGDRVIVFDRNLFSALAVQTNMTEMKIGLTDRGKEHDLVYKVHSVPIVLLPHFARVFRKI